MPRNSRDAVSGARRCHSRHLQGCVMHRCEPTILGKRWKRRVSQIPLDEGSELIEFLFARLVRVDFSRGEQALPTHPVTLLALSSCCPGLCARSGFSQ